MFFLAMLALALLALPLLCIPAALVGFLAYRAGFIRQRWMMMLVVTASMVIVPLSWYFSATAAAERCRAVNGPYDLSCGGELGGVMVFLFQWFLVLGGVVIGPILGNGLFKRFARSE